MNGKHHMKRLLLLSATAGMLSGCMVVPIVGLANLAHKSGTMTVTLTGKGDAIKVFRDAAIRSGASMPSVMPEFARADFPQVDMKVEAQVTGTQTKTIVIRGSSLSNVGRTYELKDNIGELTEKVATEMQAGGFVIQSKNRDRGI